MPEKAPIGVLIAQLGTPAEPTKQALRPYLRQFLSDRRVIDYPSFIWQPILQGIILMRRPARSARLYQRIWTDEGSPLSVYTARQASGIQERLGDEYRVIVGMRYGQPSIRSAIDQLEAEGIEQIIVLPMYPQYSSTTTASIYDAVFDAVSRKGTSVFKRNKRFVPAVRFVPPFYEHDGYIQAMKAHVLDALIGLPEQPDIILFTFHGIPNRYVQTGDPYRRHCERTAQLLADALGLADHEWKISFQSQFGPEKWLQPYTEDVLQELSSHGVERVAIFSPGFVADCLETLDELGNEGKVQFQNGGGDGDKFHFVSCLNDSQHWIDVLANIVEDETRGLPEYHPANANTIY